MVLDESKLHLKIAKSPLATVEVDVDSLEAQGKTFPDVIYESLVEYAEDQWEDPCFSVYTYFTQSVTFNEPTNSFFTGVVGEKGFLKSLLRNFSSISGVQARFSDYIDPKQSVLEYHVESGYVWRRYEPGLWWREDEEYPEQEETEIEVDKNNVEKVASSSGAATRYRAARNDASIRSIKKTIEQVFGLPEGSVALVKPDGGKIRADATVGTLRRNWEY